MLARLRVNLPDRTGSLARIATAVGNANADIESVTVLQGHEGGRAFDELTVDVVDSATSGRDRRCHRRAARIPGGRGGLPGAAGQRAR